jgi:hypothetical protein
MKTGMLWFDDDPKRTLYDKISIAAKRFHEKYGKPADACYINPTTANGDTLTAIVANNHRLHIKQVNSIRPNHFWLGMESES